MSKVRAGGQLWPKIRFHTACSFHLNIICGPALPNRINHANHVFHLIVAAPLYNSASLCDPCSDPYQLISAIVTVDEKSKGDAEGGCFEEGWKLQYFFTENQNICVCLICKETVAVCKEFNVKRHYQTKHANANDKLSGSNRTKKVKQLEAVLA